MILFITASVSLLLLVSLYLRYCRAGRLMARIPGPKGWPIIGNTLDVVFYDAADLFKFNRFMYKKYGKVNRLHGLNTRCVNIYEPEDIETILATTRFNEKQFPYEFLRPWLCEGLLTGNGDKWHRRRKMLTPAFHFKIMRQFARTFSEQTQLFLKQVELEVGRPRTEVGPLINKHTLRIMCETSMGTSMNEGIESISNKYFKAIQIIGQCVLYRVLRIWLYSDFVFQFTKIAKLQRQALQEVHSFTNKIIKERKVFKERGEGVVTGERGSLAMLDLLLENERDGKIDIDGIREEVDTFMFEGHDTTAIALTYMMMRIANEPHVQAKIYEELNMVFGESDHPPKVEELNELKYLECCIKESMRLYPSVPFIARMVNQEVTLSGYTIPKGTCVQVNVFDIHRRADIYPEPERFIPERFLPENISRRHPYSYIPFSAGPRNCIGQKFAILELKTVLSGLLRRFALEPVTSPRELQFLTDLVLRPTSPVYVRFQKRRPTLP